MLPFLSFWFSYLNFFLSPFIYLFSIPLNVQPTVCWSPTCWYMVAGVTGGCSPKSMELQATRFFLDPEILPYFWSSSMSEPSFSASHTPQWSKTGKTVCKSPVIIDNSPFGQAHAHKGTFLQQCTQWEEVSSGKSSSSNIMTWRRSHMYQRTHITRYAYASVSCW